MNLRELSKKFRTDKKLSKLTTCFFFFQFDVPYLPEIGHNNLYPEVKETVRAEMTRQRDRGRIITEAGKEKIKQAIRAWELEHERRCTQEQLKEMTGLDPSTSSKIINAKGGADRSKIEDLFRAFGLKLEEADLRSTQTISAPEPNPNFVGREDAIVDLNALIRRGAKLIVIQARGGVGKTTLAWEYFKTQGFKVLELWMAKETQNIASVEGVIEEWLRRYFDEEPGREFAVTLERLRQKLRDPAQKIGILIDNLEPALDQSGKLVEAHRRYVELMRVLSDRAAQSVTLITSRERLQEVDFGFEHYVLRSLDQQAWQQFFDHHGIQHDETALTELHRAYGGNAKAMEILHSVVQADFGGDLAEYWQVNQDDLLIERALEDLVIQQFNRLQKHDLDAYTLLCRMGCYRFQDIPTVPLEGLLCLLWDVPEIKRRRVIRALQDRSLAEFEDGQFWLHPVIQSEAIKRFQRNSDWELSNQAAANFWTGSVKTIKTISDATIALEAYHHYVAINDFDNASNVIIQERNTIFEHNEALGCAFYRLGLFQQMISSITKVLDKANTKYILGRLNNILGDLYWLTGRVREAIACHEESGRITKEALRENDISDEFKIRFRRLYVVHFFNLGLCRMELLEFQEALHLCEEVCLNANSDGCHHYVIDATYCLAFLNSVLGRIEEARQCLEEFKRNKDKLNDVWGQAYSYLFIASTYKNMGDIDSSFRMYDEAVRFAEEAHFTQVKAKAFSGLGEIYRIQELFESAIEKHSEAIALLN